MAQCQRWIGTGRLGGVSRQRRHGGRVHRRDGAHQDPGDGGAVTRRASRPCTRRSGRPTRSTARPSGSRCNECTADWDAGRPSGPSRHTLRTRTWVTARNHRRITAPQTRTFNHGAALGPGTDLAATQPADRSHRSPADRRAGARATRSSWSSTRTASRMRPRWEWKRSRCGTNGRSPRCWWRIKTSSTRFAYTRATAE